MSTTEMLDAAQQAARIGGDILLDWSERFSVSEKSPADLVTEADFASQEAIFTLLRQQFPDHGFLGEEGLEHSGTDSGYRWIIDPLDGTSNYVHGFPYFAVSIGLEHKGELILGVILDPTRDEAFTAIRGGGAHLNGDLIQPSDCQTLDKAMVVASLPVNTQSNHPAVARFLRVMPHVQTIQRTGSAALNLAYVASGRIDGFWSSNLKPWDMAAGAIIVTEAGGSISQMSGAQFDVDVPDLLACSNTSLTKSLSELLVSDMK